MEYAIEINNLWKKYHDFTLDKISFSIAKGTVVGLIGENGAGKSTMINSILGIIDANYRSLKYFGKEYKDNEKEIKKVVLYDRPDMDNQILEGKLIFDDNSEIIVGELPNNGEPLEVQVDKNSKNVKFVVTKVSVSTESVGLAEIEVY